MSAESRQHLHHLERSEAMMEYALGPCEVRREPQAVTGLRLVPLGIDERPGRGRDHGYIIEELPHGGRSRRRI